MLLLFLLLRTERMNMNYILKCTTEISLIFMTEVTIAGLI